MYSENDLVSMVRDPLVPYCNSLELDSQSGEELYSHEDVFREFARRLNQRIGTNIPV